MRPNIEKLLFPIGFGYIATAIERAGFQFELLDLDVLRLTDEQIEEKIKNTDFDVVAMGCIVTGYKYVKRLAELIKKHNPNATIIAGNSVADSVPETLMAKTKVDIGVISEGDSAIIELLEAIESRSPLRQIKGIFYRQNGWVFFTETREAIANLDSLPFINYEIFDVATYLDKIRLSVTEPYPTDFEHLRALPINTARGCPYRCTFCYHVFKDVRYRTRSMEHVGREIELLQDKYGLNYIQFFDELSLFSKEQANRFADYFLDNNVNVFWTADCRAGLFKEEDLPLARKLRQAGCVSLGFSLESADKEILKAMNKNITVDDFITQTRVLQKAGINPSTSLVIGYPQETEETLQKTFDVCYDTGVYPSAGYLLPQPKTPIYQYAQKMGKIKDEEEYLFQMGDRQDFRINLTNMKQERIEELVKGHLKRIADKLGLGLTKEQLIKSGHYRQKKLDEQDNHQN